MKNTHLEKQVFNVRLVIAIVMILLLFILVVSRLAYLQVVNHEYYSELSTGNRIRIEPMPPNRGLIYDRHGVVLAENVPSFELVIIPEETSDLTASLATIEQYLPLSSEQRGRFLQNRKRYRSFEQIPILHQLSEAAVATIAANILDLPGVHIRASLSRHYPLGPKIVHVLGYMGGINDKDLKRINERAYAGTSHIGKTGIEQTYETQLLGEVGYRQVLSNAQGRQLDVVAENTPTSGANLQLTLDADLQAWSTDILKDKRASIVALNPQNGEILALVSTPTYDGNDFSRGLSQAEYDVLLNDLDRPLLNRALSGTYPPGSTVKPMIGLAGLELGKTNRSHSTVCKGFFELPDNERPYRDWKREGHGRVNLLNAISESCDVYFYELAMELGIDNMHDFLKQFMLGTVIEPGIRGSRKGILPSRAWKKANFRNPDDQKWYHGETVIAGIGQGYMLASPLQLATATAIVATRGDYHQPHLVKRIGQDYQLDFSDDSKHFKAVKAERQHWDEIIGGMESVMHGERGTARFVGRNLDFRMAGKSGTAQVYTLAEDEEYNAEELTERLRDHALFIAFAPVDKPVIAVAVVIENGGSGSSVAAPIAAELIKRHFANIKRANEADYNGAKYNETKNERSGSVKPDNPVVTP